MSNCTRSGDKPQIVSYKPKNVYLIKTLFSAVLFALLLLTGNNGYGQCGTNICPQYPRAARTSDHLSGSLPFYRKDLAIAPSATNTRTNVVFNEYICLPAADVTPVVACTNPSNCNCTNLGDHLRIRAWYIDEHALSLGITQVSVKKSTGTTVLATAPVGLVGGVWKFGVEGAGGTDVAAGGGRPLRPSLFVTDLGLNNDVIEPYIGDWQQGGRSYNPTNIIGTFKTTTSLIDSTVSPPKITLTPGANPATNNVATLGAGNQPPAGTATDKFNSLVEWDVDALNTLNGNTLFELGHTYRLQFMVHDGDQNKSGGDVGQRCVTIHINNPPKPSVINPQSVCSDVASVTFSQVEPFDASYSYSWRILTANSSATGNVIGSSTGHDFVVDPTSNCGVIKVELTKSRDGNSLLDTGVVNIIPVPTGNVLPSPAPAVCGNSTGNIYNSNLDAVCGTITIQVTHAWSITGDGFIVGSTSGPSVSVTAGASGSYTVTDLVTYTDLDVNVANAVSCPAPFSQTVIVNPIPSCEITGNATICAGSSNNYISTVTPSGGTVTHNWTIDAFPVGSSFIVGSSTAAGVTVQSLGTAVLFILSDNVTRNGCAATGACTKTVNVNPIPTCNITGPVDVCAGATNQYCSTVSPAGGVVTHQWSVTGFGQINGSSTGSCVSVTSTGPAGTTYTVNDNVSRDGCFSNPGCSLVVNNRQCSIDLVKTANRTSVEADVPTPVTYTYNACNTGALPIINAVLVDDKATPGNTADDVTVATGQSFAVGQCKTFTYSTTVTIPAGTPPSTNIACIHGESNGMPVSDCDDETVWPVDITLVKTAYPLDIPNGTGSNPATTTAVTYTYVACNTGAHFSFSGNLVDDNGTPGNTSDDFTVASSVNLAPGACQTYTATRGLSTGRTNIAKLCGTSGNNTICTTDDATVVDHPVSLSLTKTPCKDAVLEGGNTPVNYIYVVTNTTTYVSSDPTTNALFSATNGVLTDDNGTPGMTSDDVTVCTFGPLVQGASQQCDHIFNLSGARTNIATARANFGTARATATATATVNSVTCLCDILHEYPSNKFNSGFVFDPSNPRLSVYFNEQECAPASSPSSTTCSSQGSLIKLWYIDEHALTMGVNSIEIKTSAGTTTTTSTVCAFPNYNAAQLGFTSATNVDQSGDDDARDKNGNQINLPHAYSGRPLRPSLFITDVTSNPSDRSGDWQNGGTAIAPTSVVGTWKATKKLIDKTVTPWKISFVPDANPAVNAVSTLGSSNQPPAGTPTDKFNAVCIWDPALIGYPFQANHKYRLQFMVHDGDQNKSGGDVGQRCATYFHEGGNNPACNTPKTDETGADALANESGNIQSDLAAAQFSVFPNPASNKLSMTFVSPLGGDARITMTDVSGKLLSDLYNGKVESGQVNSKTVNMNNFASGVYIIQFKSHDSIITQKLILEK